VALRIIRDLLCALEAVHTLRDAAGMPLGLIHRDLSPSNVLVSIEGSVKLADFGIARAASGSHATTGVNMKGTVAYLSPEQAMGASVDARADLFAVGAVLYEMLSGAPIYDEEDPRLILARARAGDVQSLSVAKPDAPFAIVELVDRALSATPADRFPSAAVMRAEVERVADRTCGLAPNEELSRWVRGLVAATPTPEFVTTRDENLSTGHRRIVVLAALATCLLSLAGYWLFRRSAPASTTRFDATNVASTPTVPPGLSEPRPRADDLPTATVPESHPLPSSEALKAEGRPEGRVTTLRRPPTVAAAASAARGTENGFLDIGSEPGFAYVAIDGVKVGATPLFGREITPGTHRIEVSREGLGEKSFTIDVHPGDRIRRVIKLP